MQRSQGFKYRQELHINVKFVHGILLCGIPCGNLIEIIKYETIYHHF